MVKDVSCAIHIYMDQKKFFLRNCRRGSDSDYTKRKYVQISTTTRKGREPPGHKAQYSTHRNNEELSYIVNKPQPVRNSKSKRLLKPRVMTH